jgi:hypothetical protein
MFYGFRSFFKLNCARRKSSYRTIEIPAIMSNVKTRPLATGAALERENRASASARDIFALKPYFRVATISGVMCQSNW